MPIDILTHIKSSFLNFSTKSIFGDVIANPISIASLILLSISLILWSSDGLNFKFVFYTFVIVLGLVILQQNVLKQRFNEKIEQQNITAGVPQITNLPPIIQPRPSNEISDTAIFGAAPIKNYPGYNNLVQPYQVPHITSSADLLAYVERN